MAANETQMQRVPAASSQVSASGEYRRRLRAVSQTDSAERVAIP